MCVYSQRCFGGTEEKKLAISFHLEYRPKQHLQQKKGNFSEEA